MNFNNKTLNIVSNIQLYYQFIKPKFPTINDFIYKLYNIIVTKLLEDNSIPSIKLHLIGSLLLIFIVSMSCGVLISCVRITKDMKLFKKIIYRFWKFCLLLFPIIIVCIVTMYLLLIDDVIKQRLIARNTAIITTNNHSFHSIDTTNTSINNETNSISHSNSMESAHWLNEYISSLWLINSNNDGLSKYLSETISNILKRQLALMPPGVVNVHLNELSIGSRPPIILGIQAITQLNRNECLQYYTNIIQKNINNNQINTNFQNPEDINSWLHTKLQSFITKITDFINYLDQNSTNTINNSQNIPNLCKQIVVDIEFSFISSDMKIKFSLRQNDAKNMFPAATEVIVSGMSMTGRLRMHIDLLPDYPFMGNATVSIALI